MERHRKRRAFDFEGVSVTAKRSRLPPLIPASSGMKTKFQRAIEAEEALFSQPRKIPLRRKTYFAIISQLSLSISLLDVSQDVYFSAANILYCFYMSQEKDCPVENMSDAVYASILLANDLRGYGSLSREALLRKIFQIGETDFQDRGITMETFVSLVSTIRAKIDSQFDQFRYGPKYFLDFHTGARNIQKRTGSNDCCRLAEFVLEAALHDARLGEVRDSLKAITAVDIAVTFFERLNMCSAWLPWTSSYDPRGGFSWNELRRCYGRMEDAFFKTMDKDPVFNERIVDFLNSVVSKEESVNN